MTQIVDYQTLQDAVKGMLWDRQDLDAQIPMFISLASRSIFRMLRHPTHETLFDWDTSGYGLPVAILELPGDFLELKFVLRDDQPLERISDIELKARWEQKQEFAAPRAFARIGNRLYLDPQADSVDYAYSMVYWADYSNTLEQPTDTHDVLRVAPDMFLYGALLHASPYLLDDARVPIWRSFYDQALGELMTHASEAEYAGSPIAVMMPEDING